MWFGVFLVCLGILYFLDSMHILFIDVWDFALPLLLVLIGLRLIFRSGIAGQHCRRWLC
jgi:hypothetical protein